MHRSGISRRQNMPRLRIFVASLCAALTSSLLIAQTDSIPLTGPRQTHGSAAADSVRLPPPNKQPPVTSGVPIRENLPVPQFQSPRLNTPLPTPQELQNRSFDYSPASPSDSAVPSVPVEINPSPRDLDQPRRLPPTGAMPALPNANAPSQRNDELGESILLPGSSSGESELTQPLPAHSLAPAQAMPANCNTSNLDVGNAVPGQGVVIPDGSSDGFVFPLRETNNQDRATPLSGQPFIQAVPGRIEKTWWINDAVEYLFRLHH